MSFTLYGSNQSNYDSGTFSKPPDKKWEGELSSPVGVDLGGWTSDNMMQFKVITPASKTSTVVIGGRTMSEVVITVADTGPPQSATAYYEVNTGTDGKNTDWEIDFDVYSDVQPDTGYVGKWKFTKAKSEEDKYA